MYQKVMIIGNLGSDPEMRYMSDGGAVTNFSVATSRQYPDRNNGQMIKETTWFRVTVWGRQAETCHQYLAKGRKVLVEGRLQIDAQTGGPRLFTRRDGSAGSSFEITAANVQFLGGGQNDGSYEQEQDGDQDNGPAIEEEDDIPF